MNPNDVRDKEAEAFADMQPVNAAGQVLIQETFKHAWSQALAKDPRVLQAIEALKAAFEEHCEYNDCAGAWDGETLIEHSPECLKCKMSEALAAFESGGEG